VSQKQTTPRAPQGREANQSRASRLKALLRAELSPWGLAIVLILFTVFGAVAAWAMLEKVPITRQAHARELSAAGTSLARSAAVMLANGEFTALRRLVVESAETCGRGQWRVVLPGGGVIAHSDPSSITQLHPPDPWKGSPPPITRCGDPLALGFPIEVSQRGQARLEITHWTETPSPVWWATVLAVGVVFSGAVVGLVLLHCRALSRLRGISAIREALLEYQEGQSCLQPLAVNPAWGPEAAAWNRLLRHQEGSRQQRALQDVAQALKAREEHNDLLAVACDALAQGLILVDQNCCAQYANGAAAMLLRCEREEMLGSEVSEFLNEQGVLEALRAATSGPIQRRTILESERGSEVLRFIVRSARREDAAIAMLIVEDVTQQHTARKAQKIFLGQAAHELRTPLANIRLNAEMALSEKKDDPDGQLKCVSVVSTEAIRLEQIVADILAFTEIESGFMRLKKDDIRLDGLFAELESAHGATASAKGIELSFEMPPKAPIWIGDRDKVRIALSNLIGNAVKYTDNGGVVEVTASIAEGRLVVDVVDSGIGIQDKERERIFDRFYRANDRAVSGTQGTGLGLTVAREIARMHGGDVTVESQHGKGSRFTLTIPVNGGAS
jgi:signal transduction histidine kinase